MRSAIRRPGTCPGGCPRGRWWGAGAALALLAVGGALAQGPRPPFKVTVKDDKPVTSEAAEAPLDPVQRINFQPQGLAVTVRTANNEILHLSHFPTVNIDGQLHAQGGGGRPEVINRALPVQKGRKARQGFESIYNYGDVRVTATFTLVPTKPAVKGGKRQLDSVLIHYLIENKGNKAHKIGLRVYMDVYVVSNDGAQFAAPTMPGKILNGVELKGKTLPPYVQMLQNPNLQNPGYVSHLTLDLGSKIEKAERVVLTRHGAPGAFGGWDMPAMVAGDTALGVFWEPKEVKPGGKRVIAYGYGKGIATSPESEGVVRLALGGSFAPGKAFDVTAYVTDPAPGQSLTLQLPPGMELLEGPACQPVPEPPADEPTSLVRWRARVARPGQYTLGVRSSTGLTHRKLISVSPGGE
jgi:hypothetical protein